MRYLVKSRIVIVQPFEDTPIIGGMYNFRLSAMLEARTLNKMSKDYSIQWYVLDTKTMKIYV